MEQPLPEIPAAGQDARVLRQLEHLVLAAEGRLDLANALHDDYAAIEAQVLREAYDSLVSGSNAIE